jgi:hypothetical protein
LTKKVVARSRILPFSAGRTLKTNHLSLSSS